VGLGDLGERQTTLTIAEDGSALDVEWAAADMPSFQLGSVTVLR